MKRKMIIELVMAIARCDKPTAEMLVERLTEEGLLVLGYGDSDIDLVVEQFKASFGTTRTSRQDRWAAQRLAKEHSVRAVVGITKMLALFHGEPYAPVVNSVAELEQKWVSVVTFLRKHQPDEEIQA